MTGTPSKAEFEATLTRAAELEVKLKKMVMQKLELKMVLTECQDQLKKSRDRLVDAEVKLVELQTWFATGGNILGISRIFSTLLIS